MMIPKMVTPSYRSLYRSNGEFSSRPSFRQIKVLSSPRMYCSKSRNNGLHQTHPATIDSLISSITSTQGQLSTAWAYRILDRLFYVTNSQKQIVHRCLPPFRVMNKVIDEVIGYLGVGGADIVHEYFVRRRFYQLFTLEFIDIFSQEIRNILKDPDEVIVEICAGDGTLRRALHERGIHVVAVDNLSWIKPPKRRIKSYHFDPQVQKMDAFQAIEQYRPRIVIASFINPKVILPGKIFSYPFLEHFIRVGFDPPNQSGYLFVQPNHTWSYQPIPEILPYSLAHNHDQHKRMASQVHLCTRRHFANTILSSNFLDH